MILVTCLCLTKLNSYSSSKSKETGGFRRNLPETPEGQTTAQVRKLWKHETKKEEDVECGNVQRKKCEIIFETRIYGEEKSPCGRVCSSRVTSVTPCFERCSEGRSAAGAEVGKRRSTQQLFTVKPALSILKTRLYFDISVDMTTQQVVAPLELKSANDARLSSFSQRDDISSPSRYRLPAPPRLRCTVHHGWRRSSDINTDQPIKACGLFLFMGTDHFLYEKHSHNEERERENDVLQQGVGLDTER
ncbi:hypothetical protein F2P81_012453 [Scophthalmus maximus]|uniref:Uncharacterized protein n=1 Tax=Scophthalmus maximus TaxID=52904 RepID=A0A6A4SQ67_SCOMX|nr:hypothetical protein F2P81_012453 [Scophthalmus maximus]